MSQRVQYKTVEIGHIFYARDCWWRKTPVGKRLGKQYNAIRTQRNAEIGEIQHAYFDDIALVRYSPFNQRNAFVSSIENVVSLAAARAKLRKHT
ncbi:MAG TPA: hypothetical protein VGE31_02835 [Candidatus Paceibacterota bacterium]